MGEMWNHPLPFGGPWLALCVAYVIWSGIALWSSFDSYGMLAKRTAMAGVRGLLGNEED